MGKDTDKKLCCRFTLRVYSLNKINAISELARKTGKNTNDLLNDLVETALPIHLAKLGKANKGDDIIEDEILKAVRELKALIVDGLKVNIKTLEGMAKMAKIDQKIQCATYNLVHLLFQRKSLPEENIECGDLDFIPPRFVEDCRG